MKTSTLTPVKLRLMLSISLFLIVCIAAVLFYFAQSKLRAEATSISHTVVDAKASQNNLQTLQKIQSELQKYNETVGKANSIVAASQSYQYQDQIITDLKDYATAAGITIVNLDFSTTKTGTATPTTPATGTATPAPTAPAAPAGVKSITVSATLANPVDYMSMLRFLNSIEQNLTKMQVSKISLSKSDKGNAVTSDILTIEVYVR
jgi:Sec-independent protein translocase protein TatA